MPMLLLQTVVTIVFFDRHYRITTATMTRGVVNDVANAVELALNYKAFQIAGSFDRSGHFKLVIEKNQTNDNQIIIHPE